MTHRSDTSWRDRAACRDVNPDRFFPPRTNAQTDALLFCNPCQVRLDCLRHAFEHDEQAGIWGGKTKDERARIKRALA